MAISPITSDNDLHVCDVDHIQSMYQANGAHNMQ